MLQLPLPLEGQEDERAPQHKRKLEAGPDCEQRALGGNGLDEVGGNGGRGQAHGGVGREHHARRQCANGFPPKRPVRAEWSFAPSFARSGPWCVPQRAFSITLQSLELVFYLARETREGTS